jgi:DNA-binding NarL/FixJ family response regulator
VTEIHYAVADAHTLFRKGIISILADSSHLKLVMEAANGKEVLENLPKYKPDVLLMGLNMPKMDGIDTIKEIRKTDRNLKVIVLTMYDDEARVIHLMESGANSYLVKDISPEELKIAIFSVYESGHYFSDFMNKTLLKKIVQKVPIKPLFNDAELTNRELEVLKLLCEEKTTNEISELIYLSPRSVEGIRAKLFEKIHANNIAGLVIYALRHGLC